MNLFNTILVLCTVRKNVLATPSVAMYPDYNQALNVLVPNGVSKGGTVQFLATFEGLNGTQQCEAACLASTPRCWSFVHFPDNGQPNEGEFALKVRSKTKQNGKYIQAVRVAGTERA